MKKGLILIALSVLAAYVHFNHKSAEGEEQGAEQKSESTEVRTASEEVTTASTGTLSGSGLELPCISTASFPSQLLERYSYTASYNYKTRCPNWVAWELTAEHTDGAYERKGYQFTADKDVPAPRSTYADIRESVCGYQRGHMCPAQDCKWADQAQRDAFLMTNICPQNGNLNQKDWQTLENKCRSWAKTYGTIYLCCGHIFSSSNYQTVGYNNLAVPDAFFKVVMRDGAAIGFIYENVSGHKKLAEYACTVDYVEEVTGLDFFYQLDDAVEERIESQYDMSKW